MKTIILLLLLSVLYPLYINGQSFEWSIVLPDKTIYDICDANDYLWAATDNEVYKIEKATGNHMAIAIDTLFNTDNLLITAMETDTSGLPWIGTFSGGIYAMTEENSWSLIEPHSQDLLSGIIDIAFDNNDVAWVASPLKLIKYQNNNKTIFSTQSDSINGNIYSMAIDNDNSLWLGIGNFFETKYENLLKYDGIKFTVFNSSSTCEYPMALHPIVIGENGTKWMGGHFAFTYHGIVSFNDSVWKVFDLPMQASIGPIALEKNIVWVGTSQGLLRLEDNTWTVSNMANDSLPANQIFSIVVDKNGTGTIWLGTENGLIKLKKVISSLKYKSEFEHNVLIFPNPSNDFITIKVPTKLFGSILNIYDINGRKIRSTFIDNDELKIDITQLPEGLYITELKLKNRAEKNKFIKR